ncbi:hypothetical protein IQ258_28715, partial [Coleofasciculus sp. LEGE 07081]|nr:hypothetical protein [Coleofasciculus sp. LEGE 07081]
MKLLSPEKPLIVLPQLSAAIGLNEALILQQIHYWVEKAGELKNDGFKWFYKTYKKWAVELPFLSIGTIRRAIAVLRERGLILVEQHSLKTLYRANWYTVNYEAVQELLESICPKQARRDAKSDRVDVINMSIPPYI